MFTKEGFEIVSGGSALVIGSIAAWTDWRTGTIPNRLTVSGMVAGLAASGLHGGGMGLCLSLASAFGSALVPLFLFRFGAMGGGDVKLFAALGAILGLSSALEMQFLSFVLLALAGCVVLAKRGIFIKQMRAATLWMNPFSQATFQPSEAVFMRFGPIIFSAVAITLLLKHLR